MTKEVKLYRAVLDEPVIAKNGDIVHVDMKVELPSGEASAVGRNLGQPCIECGEVGRIVAQCLNCGGAVCKKCPHHERIC